MTRGKAIPERSVRARDVGCWVAGVFPGSPCHDPLRLHACRRLAVIGGQTNELGGLFQFAPLIVLCVLSLLSHEPQQFHCEFLRFV